LYVRGIRDSIHSKRSKIYRFAHGFSVVTVGEFVLVFLIGLVLSLILSYVKFQPR